MKHINKDESALVALALLGLALNLRMFDNTNVTTDSGMTAEMRTYYHDRIIDHAEPKLVHGQFGQKTPVPARHGDTAKFRKYGTLPKALTALTEGVTPSGRKMKATELSVQVNQYGDYIEISDRLEVEAIDPQLEQATKMLGSQAGRTLDTIDREVLMGGSNKVFAPKVVGDTVTEILLRENLTYECPLTLDVVMLALGKLKRMNAEPVDADYVGIIHPDAETDLKRDKENWVDIHKYANPEKLYDGEIGRYGGVRFVGSSEAKVIGPAYLFGNAESGGVCRTTLKTALDSTGSTDILPDMTISAAQAAELTARISGGETVKLYVGGKEATISSVTAGAPGTCKFTVSAIVKDVAANAVICGTGAGKDGSAIYCTLILGANAYGTTEISGLGLEHIVKQLGSAGTADALNQRATSGWKATRAAVRLVEEYMCRIEHSSRSFGRTAESN